MFISLYNFNFFGQMCLTCSTFNLHIHYFRYDRIVYLKSATSYEPLEKLMSVLKLLEKKSKELMILNLLQISNIDGCDIHIELLINVGLKKIVRLIFLMSKSHSTWCQFLHSFCFLLFVFMAIHQSVLCCDPTSKV